MKPQLLQGSRSRILAGLVLLIAAIFVLRLFYLQIIQHDHYVAQAQAEQVKRETLPATRGEIYAMDGDTPVKLVMNQMVYTVFVDPVIIEDTEEVAKVMREIAGGNLRDNFEELLSLKSTRYQIIANRVTRAQADKIKEKDLSGIGFVDVSQRVYPEGVMAAQTLGFVNAEGVGNYGVEGYLNTALTGKAGRLETVKDVSDVPLTIGDRNIRDPAVNGENVVLTLDRNVQSKVEEVVRSRAKKLNAGLVSAVVMDPKTGRVMAMANTPSYNPAEYYKVTDAAVFNNSVISKSYEPGSTVKTFTMSAALDKNIAKASDTYYNSDRIVIDDYTISNATLGNTGVISFQTAMNWSLNTGFVTLGMRMGDGNSVNATARNTIYQYFHDRFRLGQASGIELSNEAPGRLVPPTEAEGNEIRYANMTFGQGMDSTMIQVAAGFSALVNGGDYYKPTILAGSVEDGQYVPAKTPQPTESGVISSAASKQIRDMTRIARASTFSQADKSGYAIGGKTGTAQIPEAGGYSDSETIATYVGYGGASAPEYVIMVSVYGKDKVFQGSYHAAPIFTEISNWMLDYLKIQPKG